MNCRLERFIYWIENGKGAKYISIYRNETVTLNQSLIKIGNFKLFTVL